MRCGGGRCVLGSIDPAQRIREKRDGVLCRLGRFGEDAERLRHGRRRNDHPARQGGELAGGDRSIPIWLQRPLFAGRPGSRSALQWLYAGLAKAGFPVICIETRHAQAVLSAWPNKTDRNNARGIAQMMRVGLYRPVHVKTLASQKIRALLSGRRFLQAKLLDVENSIRGLLRNFGLKVGMVTRARYEARILELIKDVRSLQAIIEPLLMVRRVIREQYVILHKEMLALARADDDCLLLMSAPGVGPLIALTYRAASTSPRVSSARARLAPISGWHRERINPATSTGAAGPPRMVMRRYGQPCSRRRWSSCDRRPNPRPSRLGACASPSAGHGQSDDRGRAPTIRHPPSDVGRPRAVPLDRTARSLTSPTAFRDPPQGGAMSRSGRRAVRSRAGWGPQGHSAKKRDPPLVGPNHEAANASTSERSQRPGGTVAHDLLPTLAAQQSLGDHRRSE